MKGALRESAARLVHALERGDELLARLFGDDRTEGLIRVGPLHAATSDPNGGDPITGRRSHDGASTLTLRHHVTIQRATRQAAPGRLFSHRVTSAGHGLRFYGELHTAESLQPGELALLRSAIEITDQVGGGRGRGLGFVHTRLQPLEPTLEPIEAAWPSAARPAVASGRYGSTGSRWWKPACPPGEPASTR